MLFVVGVTGLDYYKCIDVKMGKRISMGHNSRFFPFRFALVAPGSSQYNRQGAVTNCALINNEPVAET